MMSYCHRGCLLGCYGYSRLLLWALGREQTPGSTRHANPLLTLPIRLPPSLPWQYTQSRLLCGVFDHISFKLLQSNCTISKQACHDGWKHGRGAAGVGIKDLAVYPPSCGRSTRSSSLKRKWRLGGRLHTQSCTLAHVVPSCLSASCNRLS